MTLAAGCGDARPFLGVLAQPQQLAAERLVDHQLALSS
jgi:hypothetical protein